MMNSAVRAAGMLITVVSVIVLLSLAVCCFLRIQPAVVMSDSMMPVLDTGDLCFVDRKDRDVCYGEVIAFERGDLAVVHRVIDITEDGIVTKGDANKRPDMGYVRDRDVIGRMIFSIPFLGYAAYYASQPPGIIICLIILAAFAVLWMRVEMDTAVGESMNRSVKELMDESKELMDETVNEPVDESVNEPVDESVNETMNESVNETMNESINETINKRRNM